jgi:hypothetical protein
MTPLLEAVLAKVSSCDDETSDVMGEHAAPDVLIRP